MCPKIITISYHIIFLFVCQLLSHVWLFATPCTVDLLAPLSMEIFRQEHWSGLPFPSPGDFSQPRDQTQVSHIAGGFFTRWATREAHGDKCKYLLKEAGHERKQHILRMIEKEDRKSWIIHDIIEPPNQPCNLLAPDFLLNEVMIIV